MPENLTWGILSTARINSKVMPGIRESGSGQIIAVASRSPELAADYASDQGIPKSYGSYDDLLADSKIDCIYNPLPNSMHAEWTIKALRAGKHVLCEKPFAANADEAREMAAVAEETGNTVMEAFMYRFHPQWERVRTFVENDEIGDVRLVRAEFGFSLSDPENVRLSAKLAGGALMDVGCYCLNASRQIAGEEPEWVSAVANYDETSGVDEIMGVLLRFPSGILAEFSCSFNTSYRHSVDVIGTDGKLHMSRPWTPGPGQEVYFNVNRNDRIETIVVPPADQYSLQVRHFSEVVTGHSSLRWGTDDAISQMSAIDAISRSARERQPVAL